jgi:hypothetical protein
VSPALIEIVLVGLNVDRGLRDAVTGDLIEERAGLATTHGERDADRLRARQLARHAGGPDTTPLRGRLGRVVRKWRNW